MAPRCQGELISAAALARRENVEMLFSMLLTEKARMRNGTEIAREIGTAGSVRPERHS